MVRLCKVLICFLNVFSTVYIHYYHYSKSNTLFKKELRQAQTVTVKKNLWVLKKLLKYITYWIYMKKKERGRDREKSTRLWVNFFSKYGILKWLEHDRDLFYVTKISHNLYLFPVIVILKNYFRRYGLYLLNIYIKH